MTDPRTDDLTTRFPERELVARTRELRALARHLVGEQDADDVVQESMTIALRQPPTDRTGVSAWIRTVVRSVASNHRRSSTRRRARELAAARPELEESTDSLAQQRESVRQLLSAVLTLDEPYRETITLRYFQDLRPTQIAARTGVPLATVKSRLQRGLARLRADLSESTPRWRSGLAIALGLRMPGHPSPARITNGLQTVTTQGAFWMSKSTKTMAAFLPILIGTLAVLFLHDEDPQVTRDDADGLAAARFSEREGSEPDRSPLRRGVRLPESMAIAVDLEHPHEFALQCQVLDSNGYPVEGVQLTLAPPRCAWNAWPVATDRDGMLTIRWWGRSRSVPVAIGVLGPGSVVSPRLVSLIAETTSRQTFLATELIACSMANEQSEIDCASCHRIEESSLGSSVDEAPFRLHPSSTFSSLEPPARPTAPRDRLETPPPHERADPIPRFVGGGPLSVIQRMRNRRSRSRTAETTGTGLVEGRVFDMSGLPVPGALVTYGEEFSRTSHRTKTSKDGRYRFEGVPVGPAEVRSVHPELGAASTVITVGADQTSIADLGLALGSVIRGSVRGAEDQKVEGWTVEFRSDDGGWSDAVRVRSDGGFLLANQPTSRGTLTLTPKNGTGLPIAWMKGVLADRTPVVFDLRDQPLHGSLALVAGSMDQTERLPRFEIRLWQIDTGRGCVIASDAEGSVRVSRLPAGYYRAEYGAPGVGWETVESIWIDGRNRTELGRVSAPVPATLLLPDGAGSSGLLQLYRRTASGDRYVTEFVGNQDRELRLPSGRWLALGQTAQGVLYGEEFELTAGATTRWERKR